MSAAGPKHSKAASDPTTYGAGSVPHPTARRARGPVGVGAFLAGGLALSLVYRTTGLGIPCPFRAVTGWQCPLCGATRMGAELLRGDLPAAFGYNPGVFIALVVLALSAVAWTVAAVGGPTLRLPRRLADPIHRVPGWSWICVAAAAAVLYAVLRNLL
ncbi:DUF2752 domain-containing protein [Microlunatus elymi]|uniref:DUF2752 domain-containing protein n=1 Tax=Microlunatus elymi TaxID=2596828 RepID=UPI001AF023C6|nr:DUF2752 domain-containing protein [Microlunatus elymi]